VIDQTVVLKQKSRVELGLKSKSAVQGNVRLQGKRVGEEVSFEAWLEGRNCERGEEEGVSCCQQLPRYWPECRPLRRCVKLSRRQHLRNAHCDAVWNSLPKTVLNIDSLAVFKSRLKTNFLFSQAFLLSPLTNALPAPSATEVTILLLYTNLFIIIIIIFLEPTSTKPQAEKLG